MNIRVHNKYKDDCSRDEHNKEKCGRSNNNHHHRQLFSFALCACHVDDRVSGRLKWRFWFKCTRSGRRVQFIARVGALALEVRFEQRKRCSAQIWVYCFNAVVSSLLLGALNGQLTRVRIDWTQLCKQFLLLCRMLSASTKHLNAWHTGTPSGRIVRVRIQLSKTTREFFAVDEKHKFFLWVLQIC